MKSLAGYTTAILAFVLIAETAFAQRARPRTERPERLEQGQRSQSMTTARAQHSQAQQRSNDAALSRSLNETISRQDRIILRQEDIPQLVEVINRNPQARIVETIEGLVRLQEQAKFETNTVRREQLKATVNGALMMLRGISKEGYFKSNNDLVRQELVDLNSFVNRHVVEAISRNDQWTNNQLSNLVGFLNAIKVGIAGGRSFKNIVESYDFAIGRITYERFKNEFCRS